MEQLRFTPPLGQRISISLGDRWQVYQRLQELDIPCHCLSDGNVHVEVNTLVAIVQVWSVIHKLTTPRQQLIEFLRRCW